MLVDPEPTFERILHAALLLTHLLPVRDVLPAAASLSSVADAWAMASHLMMLHASETTLGYVPGTRIRFSL